MSDRFEDSLPVEAVAASSPATDDHFDSGVPLSPEEEAKRQASTAANPEQWTKGESALMGAGAGMTFDFDDEFGGAGNALLEKMANAVGYNPEQNQLEESAANLNPKLRESFLKENAIPEKGLGDLYTEYRDLRRGQKDAAMKANPWSYTGGAVGGGFLIPGAAIGQAGKTASLGEKVARGMAVGAGAGALQGAGSSKANPIEDPGQLADDTWDGFKLGGAVGGVIPVVGAGAKGVAKGAKWLASPVIKGFKQGLRGNNLLGDEAEKLVQAKIVNFGKDVSNKIIDELNGFGKLKKDLMDIAKDMGVKLSPDEIDAMIVKNINPDDAQGTISGLKNTRREMEDLKELIRHHKQGPEVKQVKRVFYGDKETQLKKFEDLLAQKQNAQNAKVNPDLPMEVPQTHQDAFEEVAKRKQMELDAVPGSKDTSRPSDLETEYIPVEGSDEVLGVVKQRTYDPDGNFTGWKKVYSKQFNPSEPVNAPKPKGQPLEAHFEPLGEGRVQGIIREPIVDEAGNITSYKVHMSKAMDEAEAAKFKDITETVRAGGKDLSDIGNFKGMLDDLNEVGQYGNTPYQSKEASNAAGKMYTEGRDMLRGKVDSKLREEFGADMPTLEGTDNNISSLKKGIEHLRLGDETVNRSINDKQKAYEAVMSLVNSQEMVGKSGGAARERVRAFVEEIRKVNPSFADEVERQFADLGEQAIISKTTAGITDANKMSGNIKRQAVAAGNFAGLTAKKVADTASKAVGVGKKISDAFVSSTPDEIRALGQKLLQASSNGKQELGRILSQLPDKTERERNAILFGVMQNPAYRKWLEDEQHEILP